MASTFKAVINTMNDLSLCTWVVKGKSGNLLAYQYDKLDIDVSIDRLKNVLLEQRGDFIRVEIGNQKSASKGGDNYKVIKMDVDLSTLNPGAASPVNFSIAESSDFKALQKMVADQNAVIMKLSNDLIESRYKNEIEALKQQIAGIQEQDSIGKMADTLLPLIAAYIPNLLPAPQKNINGIAPEESETFAEYLYFLKLDPEAPKVIEAISRIAETAPATYASYKKMLLSM